MPQTTPQPQADDSLAMVVGENIRRIRALRGITSLRLSQDANVARGTLHQLESGKGNPRMDTLYALAKVLNVTLSDLVTPPAPERMVIRSGQGPVTVRSGLEARLLRSFHLATGLLELSELKVAPGAELVSDPHQPDIYEHVLILEGVLRVGPVGDEEVLHPGDYMKFEGDRRHRYEVIEGPVRGILMMEYPSQVGIHDSGSAAHAGASSANEVGGQ